MQKGTSGGDKCYRNIVCLWPTRAFYFLLCHQCFKNHKHGVHLWRILCWTKCIIVIKLCLLLLLSVMLQISMEKGTRGLLTNISAESSIELQLNSLMVRKWKLWGFFSFAFQLFWEHMHTHIMMCIPYHIIYNTLHFIDGLVLYIHTQICRAFGICEEID